MIFRGWLPRDERGDAWDEASLRARAEGRSPGSLGSTALEEILAWNLRLGAGTELAKRARALVSGEGLAIVTGQQPALFGGPLYTLYKLLFAQELAAEIEARFARPTLAVFWLVGDDSDFGEVSSAWLPDGEARALQFRDGEAPGKGALIGRLASARQRVVWDEARALASAYPSGAEVAAELDQIFALARDWSEVQAALFFRLSPDAPVLVVDGAGPALLAASRDLLLNALESWPIAALLQEGAAEARALGHEPALDAELAERALFRIEGDARRPLEAGEDARAGEIAPNVVLRPLLQDWLLPNIATVCGPSEVRYRARLGPLYRHARIAEPLRPSRLHGVLLPPLGEAGSDWKRAASEPSAFSADQVESVMPDASRREVEAVRADFARRLSDLSTSLAGFDTSLQQLAESAAGKIDFQLQRLEDGVKGKARHRLGQRAPLLLALESWLRPREREQERVHSLLLPWLLEGKESIRALRDAAREEVRARLDGSVAAERSAVFELEAAPEKRRTGG